MDIPKYQCSCGMS